MFAALIEFAAYLFAGLGLFFAGIRLLSEHLRRLTDHRLRGLIASATASGRGAAALGLVSGSVMQSMNAVVFVLISLVRAGLIGVRRAHTVINYANLGSSVLVLMAAFKPKLFIFAVVGVTGILLYSDRNRSAAAQDLIRTLLGAGLLFLGLTFIKDAGAMAGAQGWLQALFKGSAQSFLLAFLVGSGVAFLIHSASSVTIIVIALASSGAIDLQHAIAVVYGAGLGAAGSTRALGAGHRGVARQLVLYQSTLKVLGLALLLPLSMVEFFAGVPLLAAFLQSLPVSIGIQISLVYLAYQLACDLVMHPLHHQVAHRLEIWAPQTAAEEIGQWRFLYHGAEKDPSTAVLLSEQEQQRIVELLPAYLDSVRSEAGALVYDRQSLHQGCQQLTESCGKFLERLLAIAPRERSFPRALVLEHRNQLLAELQESLNELAEAAGKMLGGNSGEAGVLMDGLVESVHVLILTLQETARSGDPEDLAVLQTLTGDRAELMHSLRVRLLADATLDTAHREALLAAASLVERLVWLMRRYSLLLGPTEAT